MTKTKLEFIREFGEAYHRFGLPKLMGRIVGLLLYVEHPVSLDKITQQLNVSKGPVSQMVRRLKDHHLIEHVWIPGDRKDYYKAEKDIFGIAFQNHMELMRKNLNLARKYKSAITKDSEDYNDAFHRRIDQMAEFYQLMMENYERFLSEWREQISK